MSSIAERIKELRKSHNLTQEEFGQKFGIVKSTVSLYENGKSTPNDELKNEICEYFEVSLDYLCGRTNQISNYNTSNGALSIINMLQSEYGSSTCQALKLFTGLNEKGKLKTLQYMNDLLNIPQYTFSSKDKELLNA